MYKFIQSTCKICLSGIIIHKGKTIDRKYCYADRINNTKQEKSTELNDFNLHLSELKFILGVRFSIIHGIYTYTVREWISTTPAC
ncbi:MAG: hypothetical protein WCJ01_02230 [Ignavibacteria bacterium]